MRYALYVFGGLILVLGLACHAHLGVGVGVYSPGETAYLERAMQEPLTFVVPEAKGEEAWTRIKEFIGEHSTMKIQTLSDARIETVRPAKPGEYGYSASRVSSEGNHTISVSCHCPDPSEETGKVRERNAHILAHYALTGEIMPKLIAK